MAPAAALKNTVLRLLAAFLLLTPAGPAAGATVAPDTNFRAAPPPARLAAADDTCFQIFIPVVMVTASQAGNSPASAAAGNVCGSPPVLSNLVAPASVPFDGLAVVEFDFADAEGDIAAVESSQSSFRGTITGTVPAALVPISGTAGHIALSMPASRLPFGPITITLAARDGQGLLSNELAFAFSVVGNGVGSAPAISSLHASVTNWTRPAGALDRLTPLSVSNTATQTATSSGCNFA